MPQTPDERITSNHRTLAVLGAGYVGLGTAAGLAHLGHRVRVGESDPDRLRVLRGGGLPVVEPGLDDLIGEGVRAGRINFFADNAEAVEGAAAVFIAVPTPEGPGGAVDLGFVLEAISSIAGHALPPVPLVLKSSVPPGAAERIMAAIDASGMTNPLVINPEFLQEGRTVEGILRPYRVVIGGDHAAAVALVAELNEPLDAPIIRTDLETAALTKYAANSYLATRLTFVNAMAHLAEDVGADVDALLDGLAADPRIGSHYLQPGPGYGGSCFPKDVCALIAAAAEHGHDLRLLRTVVETNDAQLDRVVAKVRDGLGGLAGTVVGLLSLAFKGGTDDTRSSPAVALAERLIAEGARIRAYDPIARIDRRGLEMVPDELAAATGADALLIATEWPQFADLDPAKLASVMRGRVLVDARDMFDREAGVAAGFDYRGLGR